MTFRFWRLVQICIDSCFCLFCVAQWRGNTDHVLGVSKLAAARHLCAVAHARPRILIPPLVPLCQVCSQGYFCDAASGVSKSPKLFLESLGVRYGAVLEQCNTRHITQKAKFAKWRKAYPPLTDSNSGAVRCELD